MKIATGLAVDIEYELKVKGGDVIESSSRSGPLRYVHGDGKMLPGLEKRLAGLSPGDEKRGDIPAAEAFGTEDKLPIKEMPRAAFPAGADLKVGSVFGAKDPVTGAPVQFKVISIDGESANVRLLHPLVGRDIEFRVKVLSVRDPKAPVKPPPPPGVVELDLDDVQES
jgi:FKBP-type peptidyl-prolyl cis-trans isomerase SlyD